MTARKAAAAWLQLLRIFFLLPLGCAVFVFALGLVKRFSLSPEHPSWTAILVAAPALIFSKLILDQAVRGFIRDAAEDPKT